MNKVCNQKINLFLLLVFISMSGLICSMEHGSGDEAPSSQQTARGSRDKGKERLRNGERPEQESGSSDYQRAGEHSIASKASPNATLEFLDNEIKRLEKSGNSGEEKGMLASLKIKKAEFQAFEKAYNTINIQVAKLRSILAELRNNPENDEAAVQLQVLLIEVGIVIDEQTEIDTSALREIIDIFDTEASILEEKMAYLADSKEEEVVSVPTFARELRFQKQSSILTVPSSYRIAQQNNCLQLAVLKQGESTGGAASCGYQAYKNCAVIARLLLSSPEQQSQLLHELTSLSLVKNTFGSLTAPWRSAAILVKKREEIKRFMNEILDRLINQTYTELVGIGPDQSHVLSELKLVRANVVTFLVSRSLQIKLDQVDPCIIDGESLVYAFQAVLEQKSQNGIDYVELIRPLEPIIKNLVFEITKNAIHERATGSSQGLSHDQGEWLHSDEMRAFIENECFASDSLFKGIEHVPVLVVEEGRSSGLETAFLQINEGGTILEQAKKLFFDNDALTHLIMGYQREIQHKNELDHLLVKLATKEQERDFSAWDNELGRNGEAGPSMAFTRELNEHFNNLDLIKLAVLTRDETTHFICPLIIRLPGHWISVVVNKVGKNRQYIIADSINSSRIYNDRIRMLIDFLEGKEPQAGASCNLI